MLEHIAPLLQKLAGNPEALRACESLYGELLKAPTPFSSQDGIYPREELVEHLTGPICAPSASRPGLSREEAEQVVDHVPFVELCNYKGEGEGFAVAAHVPHLRTYFGKYDYAA